MVECVYELENNSAGQGGRSDCGSTVRCMVAERVKQYMHAEQARTTR